MGTRRTDIVYGVWNGYGFMYYGVVRIVSYTQFIFINRSQSPHIQCREIYVEFV